MKIFNWVKDLENIYAKLIEEAKNDNLKEIEELKAENEKFINETLQRQQQFVNHILKSTSEDVTKKVNEFQEKLKTILQNFELYYNQNKKSITSEIISKLGLDFVA